jgi:hypothetical protein
VKRIITTTAAVALLLTLAGPLSARAQWRGEPNPSAQVEMMKHFVEAMSSYLAVSEKWMKLIEDRDMAMYLAVERLVEVHKERGSKRDAVAALKDLQAKPEVSDRLKTAIQFKIIEIYKEAGDHDRALQEAGILLEALTQ